MSGSLLQHLESLGEVQGQGATILAAFDAGINTVAKLVPPLGAAVGVVEGILNLIDPPASSGPTTQDLQNQIAGFASTVEQQLTALQGLVASGQIKANAEALETVLTSPSGSLSVVGELPTLSKSPGLPLTDAIAAAQYQTDARAAVLTPIGRRSDSPSAKRAPHCILVGSDWRSATLRPRKSLDVSGHNFSVQSAVESG